jgi:2-C-methyl-D-erythritol 4-phosphate cytidylyltransferase
VEFSGIVPLPATVAENKTAAFLPLAGEATLIRTVRALLGAVAEPGRVVVAAAESLIDDVRESLAAHGVPSVGVVPVADPATRADCLTAALEYLESKTLSTRYVLLHDISQPLTPAGLADRVAAGSRSGGTVVVPALAVTDSIKSVDVHGAVTGTLDRSLLRAVQYPRAFAVEYLRGLLAQHPSGEFDELREALRAGVPITAVEGDPDALRADLPQDAAFVEAIIASRLQAPGSV